MPLQIQPALAQRRYLVHRPLVVGYSLSSIRPGPDRWHHHRPWRMPLPVRPRPATARAPSASQSFTWNVSSSSVTNPGTHNARLATVPLPIQSGGLPSGDSWTYAVTGLPSASINTSAWPDRRHHHWPGEYCSRSRSWTPRAAPGQSFTWSVSTLSVTNPVDGDQCWRQRVAGFRLHGLLQRRFVDLRCHRLAVGLSINTSSPDRRHHHSPGEYLPISTVSDGQRRAPARATWNVSTLSVTNPGTHNGAVGDSVALPIQASGLPSGDTWFYSATGLPSGLSINASSGLISGTIIGPANTYSISITASD